MVKWEYAPEVPADVRAMVEPLLLKWEKLVPVWAQRILVRLTEENDAKLTITVREDQRDAILTIHPDWIIWPIDREHAIKHELCHFYNSSLRWEATDCIKHLVGDAYPTSGSRIAESRLVECIERVNNDLVALISRLVVE